VAFAALPDALNLFAVTFYDQLADGFELSTVNGLLHTMFGRNPSGAWHDPYAATASEQLRAHVAERARLAPTHGGPRPLDLAPFLDARRAFSALYFATLGQGGLLAGDEERGVQMRWRAALAIAWKMLRGQGAAQKLRKSRSLLPVADAPRAVP